MKKLMLAGLLLCLTASMALAATPGLNFTWNEAANGKCLAAIIANEDWDCTIEGANDGAFQAVGSFTPPVAIAGFSAMGALVDGQTAAEMPAWWQSVNAGSCRQNAVQSGVGVKGSPCTVSLWPGTAYGGIGAWQTALYPPPAPNNAPLPNRLRIKVGYAMSASTVNLLTTNEYSTFVLNMDTTNSMDDPANSIVACAGCSVGMTLVLNQIEAVGTAGSVFITDQKVNRCITWQGGAGANVCSVTPVRNTTWGNVKSLYR